MGWRPHEVRAVSMSDFNACVEAWIEAQGGKPGMSEDDALDLRAELWGEKAHG